MTKDEMKNKYSTFITEISEILGLGKPVDILKLCATTDLFFQPLEKQIEELEEKVNGVEFVNKQLNEQLIQKDERCSVQTIQLSKSKELLKKFVEWFRRCDKEIKLDDTIITDAEQFLKEIKEND